jgi:hypothetical protein
MLRTAAILVLAILVHGLLMTGAVHAGEAAPHGGPDLHLPAEVLSLDGPAHDEPCFTVQNVIKSVPMPEKTGDRVTPLPGGAPDDAARTRTWIVPPHRPPDTVRALLQVYRI